MSASASGAQNADEQQAEEPSVVPTRQAVLDVLSTQPWSADLQISAFCSALQHYRRASVATPFPSHLFTNSKGEKDFKACLAAVQRLRPVPSLTAELLSRTPNTVLQLLSWLLLPENRRRNSFTIVHQQQFLQHVQANSGPNSRPPNFNVPAETPTAILQKDLDPGASGGGEGTETATRKFSQPMIGYHGTCMENMHSILNSGLLDMGHTRLKRNGAIFGAGIYLSTRFDVAFSFCQSADAWKYSLYGNKARCMLVCEVDMSKVQENEGGAASKVGDGVDTSSAQGGVSDGSGATTSGGVQGSANAVADGANGSAPDSVGNGNPDLPDSYLLVTRPDAIRLLYVMVYSDGKGPGGGGGGASLLGKLPWSLLIVLVYSVWLLLQWFMQNRQLRVQLERWWQRLGAGPEAHVPAWQRWQ